jgi:hypothetical protein
MATRRIIVNTLAPARRIAAPSEPGKIKEAAKYIIAIEMSANKNRPT